jgi:hypothetical protein
MVHVSKREMSKFISNAIRKALKEEKLKNEENLDAAYEAASRDTDHLETLQDWDALDDVSDLMKEEENWEWLKKSSDNRKG